MAIDPAFRAAPFLGESSQDPIEFARRQKTLKNAAQMKRDKEIEQNTAKGLERLMLDIKGWEDQKGFQEVMSSYNKNISAFMDLSKKGLNLTAPKTETEILAFNKLQEEHKKTVQLLNTWDRNKKATDLFNEELKQNPDKYDLPKSRANLEKQLEENDIETRNLNLENLLVRKPDIGNVWKWYKSIEDQIPKLDEVGSSYVDENGVTHTTTTRQQDPKKQEEIYKSIRQKFQYAPEDVKEAVKNQGELNKGKEPVGFTDEDRIIAMIAPEYQQKFIDKPSGSGSGGGFNINFLGSKSPIEAGELRPEALIYGDLQMPNTYIFKPTSKPLEVPLGNDAKQFVLGQWIPQYGKGGGTAEATLYAYDPVSDTFIFNTTSTSNSTAVKNNTAIRVPRSEIGNQADNLPIMKDGKKTTLKEVYGPKQVTKKKLPVQWSEDVYLPGKGKSKTK